MSYVIPNRWKCSLHQFVGRTDDNSYVEHIDAEHEGNQIAVLWFGEPDESCEGGDS